MVLLKKVDYNAKNIKAKGKSASITGLTTSFALNLVENKMPDVSNQVKKKQQIMMQNY